MKHMLSLFFSLLVAGGLVAQQGPPVTPAAPEMEIVSRLVGNWQGEGWFQTRSGKARFLQTEEVRSTINGHAIVIQGQGLDAESEELIHDALAVMTWDKKEKRYRIHAWKADGGYIEASGRAEGDMFIWFFDTPRGSVRYTIDLSTPGEWTESGEYSSDGEQWMKFIEMNLERLSE